MVTDCHTSDIGHWFAMTTPVLSASIRSPHPEVVHGDEIYI